MPTENSSAIAESMIKQMGEQVDLVLTLSLAICGGIVALGFRAAAHNHAKDAITLRFRWEWVLIAAVVAEGLSVFFAWAARGALISATPDIHALEFKNITNWIDARYPDADSLKWALRNQFATFFLGLVGILAFGIKNLRVFRGKGNP